MQLYYGKGACSLAPHIALTESGLKHESIEVDLKTKKFGESDYRTVNPKGYVPALKLDNGDVLTECAVILQYIADQDQDAKLFPKFGTLERYHAMEWLNFVATEMHKGFGAFFNPQFTGEARSSHLEKLNTRLEYLANRLQTKKFILGDTFSVVDAYAFTILNWAGYLKIDLSKWPSLSTYVERIKSRPAVLATLKAERMM